MGRTSGKPPGSLQQQHCLQWKWRSRRKRQREFWASMPDLLLSRPGMGWAEGDGSMFPLLVFMSHFLVFFTSCSHQDKSVSISSLSFSLTQLISCPFYSIHKAPLGLFPVNSNAQLPSALSPNLIYLNQPSIFASCGSLCQTGFSGLM